MGFPTKGATSDLARLLGITARRVQQLVDTGVFTRTARGEFEIALSIQAYIAHREKGGGDSYSASRARWMASRARSAEREERKLAGKLVETELVIADWGSIGKTLAQHFRAMPTLLAPRMVLCRTEAEAFTVMSEVVEQHIEDFTNAKLTFVDDEPDDQPAPRKNGNGALPKDTEDGSKIRPGD